MTRAPRPSLSGTVLRLTAVALVAVALVWSALFVDVLLKHAEGGTALSQLAGRVSDDGQSNQAPAPVTTRTS